MISVGAFILGIIVGYALGFHERNMQDLITSLRKPKEPETSPVVTPTNRAFVHENNMQDDRLTGLVSTKSPQLISWEEQEELRKLNLRPR